MGDPVCLADALLLHPLVPCREGKGGLEAEGLAQPESRPPGVLRGDTRATSLWSRSWAHCYVGSEPWPVPSGEQVTAARGAAGLWVTT